MSQPPASPPVSSSSELPVSWWRRRLLHPVLHLLRQGLTPHQLALTVALGTAAGLVPILGVTSLMATMAAVRLRLNVAATLLVAHLWSPVQLLLIIPLMRLGANVWGAHSPDLTLEKLRYLFSHDWVAALGLLWHAILGGLAIWAGTFLVLGPLLYFILRPILSRVMRPKAAEEVAT